MNIEEKLIGKTIKKVELKGHSTECDSINVLVLTMETGEVFEIVGSYGGYTGKSCDEYIETITVFLEEDIDQLSDNEASQLDHDMWAGRGKI